jgi:hypothetical protein
VPGYEDLLAILRDPGHPEHEDMRAWVEEIKGHEFDPTRFNLEWVNRRLGWINPKQLSAERNVRLFVG